MNWNKCQKEFIRGVSVDEEQIKSMISTATKRFDFTLSIKQKKDNISFIVEQYYEVIKEMLIAFLLKNGMRSKNHQCLITFFYQKYPYHEFEVNLMSEMSYLRNRLEYYGELIDYSFLEKNEQEIKKLILFLKGELSKN